MLGSIRMKMRYRRAPEPRDLTTTKRNYHNTDVLKSPTLEESRATAELFTTSEFWSPGHGCKRGEPAIRENKITGHPEICFSARCGVSEERRARASEASLISTASLGEPGEEEMGGKRAEASRRPVTDAIRSSGRSPLPGSASERGSVMGTASVYIERPAGSPVHVEEAPAAGQRMMLSTGAARSWIPNLYLFILLFFASSCHVLHAQGLFARMCPAGLCQSSKTKAVEKTAEKCESESGGWGGGCECEYGAGCLSGDGEPGGAGRREVAEGVRKTGPLASLSPPQTQPHSLSLLLVVVVVVMVVMTLIKLDVLCA
ncbi:unnamed protein product [Boreogadus saida]